MKKSMFFKMATTVLVVAMVAACGKKGDDGKKGGSDDDDDTVAQTIKVDGQFADWDTAEADGKVTKFEVGANAAMKDLKVLKLIADEYFLYVYYEFDKACLNACASNTNLNFYIDTDGGETTTYYNNGTISNSYFDYILQGSITNWTDVANGAAVDQTIISINLNTYKCPEAGTWPDWQADNIGSGYSSGAGVIDGDVIKYEYQIIRESMPMTLPSTINVMFDCQRNDTSSGVLPMNGDGAGLDSGGLPIPTGKTYAWTIN
jgi:hypothetical protein